MTTEPVAIEEDEPTTMICVVCQAETPGTPPTIDEMRGRRRDKIKRLAALAENWRCGRCLDEEGIE